MPEGMLYPIMLRLKGKRCVIIGGGKVAERKAAALLAAGADQIEVIAEQVTDDLARLGQAGLVRIVDRQYDSDDILRASLVIAATSNSTLNARIVSEADSLGIWANSVSDGDEGSFVTPAVVRRGDLVIGITTNGASPSLAARLKVELEQSYGDEYAVRLRALRLLRDRLLHANNTRSPEAEQADTKQLLQAAAADDSGWHELAQVLQDGFQTELNPMLIDRWIERLRKPRT
ncbi:precorrin-2 dehydrogenase [Paenibacillus cellulosilyticus]|uniref:precorrin-2 dehydrogenase n=1 Tax=Paenibacillus cellulosilyticus TaxID=375489 RepID=A0A2V2YJ69_9BACL|nr:bifunctional precorrin-2 dehydrogenase/sirohydrochlorin ferrochelatase [Paenibacillus cellulosilyticus]PWV92024.1 precorrin-2 dehydrogenase [Paenibacillus cellulosilyticus]QKS46706.1 bifunctional precorrin-2 dehydrogenase/sirohydrochlorin ferrochelatase [Paenibacillus cellulosilyticus]